MTNTKIYEKFTNLLNMDTYKSIFQGFRDFIQGALVLSFLDLQNSYFSEYHKAAASVYNYFHSLFFRPFESNFWKRLKHVMEILV